MIDDEPAERRRLIALAKTTGNPTYLRAAQQLRRAGDPPDEADDKDLLDLLPASRKDLLDLLPASRPPHRPEEPDMGALLAMTVLIAQDPKQRAKRAAKAVAEAMSKQRAVHSIDATTDRLRRKFRRYKDKLLPLGRDLVRHGPALAQAVESLRRNGPAVARFRQALGEAVNSLRRNGPALVCRGQALGQAIDSFFSNIRTAIRHAAARPGRKSEGT
jgi:hypothetical protein